MAEQIRVASEAAVKELVKEMAPDCTFVSMTAYSNNAGDYVITGTNVDGSRAYTTVYAKGEFEYTRITEGDDVAAIIEVEAEPAEVAKLESEIASKAAAQTEKYPLVAATEKVETFSNESGWSAKVLFPAHFEVTIAGIGTYKTDSVKAAIEKALNKMATAKIADTFMIEAVRYTWYPSSKRPTRDKNYHNTYTYINAKGIKPEIESAVAEMFDAWAAANPDKAAIILAAKKRREHSAHIAEAIHAELTPEIFGYGFLKTNSILAGLVFNGMMVGSDGETREIEDDGSNDDADEPAYISAAPRFSESDEDDDLADEYWVVEPAVEVEGVAQTADSDFEEIEVINPAVFDPEPNDTLLEICGCIFTHSQYTFEEIADYLDKIEACDAGADHVFVTDDEALIENFSDDYTPEEYAVGFRGRLLTSTLNLIKAKVKSFDNPDRYSPRYAVLKYDAEPVEDDDDYVSYEDAEEILSALKKLSSDGGDLPDYNEPEPPTEPAEEIPTNIADKIAYCNKLLTAQTCRPKYFIGAMEDLQAMLDGNPAAIDAYNALVERYNEIVHAKGGDFLDYLRPMHTDLDEPEPPTNSNTVISALGNLLMATLAALYNATSTKSVGETERELVAEPVDETPFTFKLDAVIIDAEPEDKSLNSETPATDTTTLIDYTPEIPAVKLTENVTALIDASPTFAIQQFAPDDAEADKSIDSETPATDTAILIDDDAAEIERTRRLIRQAKHDRGIFAARIFGCNAQLNALAEHFAAELDGGADLEALTDTAKEIGNILERRDWQQICLDDSKQVIDEYEQIIAEYDAVTSQ